MAMSATFGSRMPLSARDHSARRMYPRVTAGTQDRWNGTDGADSSRRDYDDFARFRKMTAPTVDEVREQVFEKHASDPFRHDSNYMAAHISLAPPPAKLELSLKDRRTRPLPSTLRPAALEVLEQPLRCLSGFTSTAGGRTVRAPVNQPSDDFFDAWAARAPPQPIPVATQRHEDELLETIEKSLREGSVEASLWGQYAKRAEELLITMSLEKILRVLKAFVMARHQDGNVYNRIGAELAKEVKSTSSTRLCQVLHWLSRAGLRDQTLMSLVGNECLLRLHDDFVLDMYIEVLNVHAKLDIRNPRLVNNILREMMPLFPDFGRDQCCAVTPLTVMQVFSEQARVAYLSRCADLGLGLPVRMTKPAILRQFRLLEDCLRLDYHPTTLPNIVQLWLANLLSEAEAHDVIEPTPLTQAEHDILRVLQEEMDVAVTPALQDGIFTLHLVMGKAIIEVVDSCWDYYVTPAMREQHLLKAETKLRHRLLWRRGWRILSLEQADWKKLKDDLFKKDFLEALLTNGPKRRPASR